MQGDEQVDMNHYLRILWRRKSLIIIGSLALGLAVLVVSLFLPRVYEAKATLIIMPPRFSTELRPEMLPVESYQTIAESEGIKAKVMKALEAKGLTSRDGEIDGELATALYPSITRDRTYLPLIDLIVEADSPEKAGLIAEAWARTLLLESADLTQRASVNVVDFIEKEFQESALRLTETENSLGVAQDQAAKLLAQAEAKWDRRIAEFQATWDLEGMRDELATVRSLLTANPTDSNFNKSALIPYLQQVRLEIQLLDGTLSQLTEEIASHSPRITLSKAITDDALWQRIGEEVNSQGRTELESLRLRTEEINPVFTKLAQELADTKVRYEALVPQRSFLEDQVTELRGRLESLHQLLVQKTLELDTLYRDRELDLERLQREGELLEKQLSRRVESAERTYGTLSQKFESARLVRGEAEGDIKIGAQAAASPKPVGPKILINTAVALATGLALMIGLALVQEFANGDAGRHTRAAGRQQ